MKKVLLAMGLMFGGVAFVNAQEQDTTSTSNQTQTEQTTTDQSTTDQSTQNQSTQDQSTQDQSMTQNQDDQDRVQIQVAELPQPVQSKLQGSDYQGWVVSSAYRKNWTDPNNTQATSQEIYIVEVKNGAEMKKLKFDKDGNEIEKKDKDQK